MRRCRVPVSFAAVLLLGASASPLHADGWKIQLQGAKALGSSYAGRSVLTDDASAVWFNPAAMTALGDGWTITAGAPVITYQLLFRDGGSRGVLGQPLQGGTENGGTTAIVPHLYVSKGMGDRARFGFGFNAPFGLGTDYGESWAGRYHATETTLSVFNLNPAFAWRVRRGLSVAAGLDVQRSTATIASMIDFGSIGATLGLPLTPQGVDGRIRFTGSDWAVGWNGGVFWESPHGVRAGASYRSHVGHSLRGTVDFTVPAEAMPLAAGFADGAAAVSLPMPAELATSVSYPLTRTWLLLGDVTWTDWSRFQSLRVRFDDPARPPLEQAANWDDSLRVAIGTSAHVKDWVVRAGVAYETTPVPDATRTPRLPEADHTWVSGSATYAFNKRWRLDVHASHLFTPDASIHQLDPASGLLQGAMHWRLTILGAAVVVAF